MFRFHRAEQVVDLSKIRTRVRIRAWLSYDAR
jgi:hypothetical protein